MIHLHDKLSEHMPVLRDAITHLIYDASSRRSPKGGFAMGDEQVGNVETSNPLQVFRVGADQIRDDTFLSDATHSGWQYLLSGPGLRAIADVRDDDDGTASFGRLIHGHLAEGLARAAELATRDHAEGSGDYEPRILEIPALYIVALWLHGADDVFYPLIPTRALNRERYDSGSFASLVVSKGRSRGAG